jgi:hypothetical protein
MRKILFLLLLLMSCASTKKQEPDYNRGWIVEPNGERHFYLHKDIEVGKKIKCYIHEQFEVIYVKKYLSNNPKI